MSSIAEAIEADLETYHGIKTNPLNPNDDLDDYILENNQTCDCCYELFPNEELQPLYDENSSGGVEMYCFDCYPEVKMWFDKDMDDKIAEKIAKKMMEEMDKED